MERNLNWSSYVRSGLLLMVCGLSILSARAYGQTSISIAEVVGGNLATEEIYANTEVVFKLRYHNGTGVNMSISNGFVIYSPDGQPFEVDAIVDYGVIPVTNWDIGFQTNVRNDWSYDTASISGVAGIQPGLPAGFDGVPYGIRLKPLPYIMPDMHVCIDSTFFEPAGTWIWAGADLGQYFPQWEPWGYCFRVIQPAPNTIPVTGYDAASHLKPDQSCPAWTVNKSPAATSTIIFDELVQTSATNADGIYNQINGPTFTPTDQVAIEFRMKLESMTTPSAPHLTPAGMLISLPGNKGMIFGIGMDVVFVEAEAGGMGSHWYGDTHLAFHTYRIEWSSSGDVRIFRNGIFLFQASLFTSVSMFPSPKIWWGDGTGGASGVTRWQYFKYNTSSTGCGGCCAGTTGNVNNTGIVDLSDLSSLVNYLTGGGYVLPCSAEANINATGIVDLSDLSALVSYLTGGGYVLPNCL